MIMEYDLVGLLIDFASQFKVGEEVIEKAFDEGYIARDQHGSMFEKHIIGLFEDMADRIEKLEKECLRAGDILEEDNGDTGLYKFKKV